MTEFKKHTKEQLIEKAKIINLHDLEEKKVFAIKKIIVEKEDITAKHERDLAEKDSEIDAVYSADSVNSIRTIRDYDLRKN